MYKGTFHVDEQDWKAFREGCLRHDISASAMLRVLIQAKILDWAQQARTEEAGELVIEHAPAYPKRKITCT